MINIMIAHLPQFTLQARRERDAGHYHHQEQHEGVHEPRGGGVGARRARRAAKGTRRASAAAC